MCYLLSWKVTAVKWITIATRRMLFSKWIVNDMAWGRAWNNQSCTHRELDGPKGKQRRCSVCVFFMLSQLNLLQNKQYVCMCYILLSSRCQQTFQVDSTEVILYLLSIIQLHFQLLKARQQTEQQHLPRSPPSQTLYTPSFLFLVNHSLISISLRPDNIFPSISRQLCHISSHLFSLVLSNSISTAKGWLSVCAAKQIDHPLISQPHSWQCSEVSERLQTEHVAAYCHILTCFSSFDLVFSPLF